jgi:hypothetical protein
VELAAAVVAAYAAGSCIFKRAAGGGRGRAPIRIQSLEPAEVIEGAGPEATAQEGAADTQAGLRAARLGGRRRCARPSPRLDSIRAGQTGPESAHYVAC